MKTLIVAACAAFAILMGVDARAAEPAMGYGQTVYVNGQRGQVISRGTNQSRVVVETRDLRGRSTGTTTLSGYDMTFRRQLHSTTPSFVVGPRNGAELKTFRSRGY
jgi:hypothetical protein